MKAVFGILQGRLSHSSDGRFQFFPPNWQLEFSLAAEFGFGAIEWLIDWPDWDVSPILIPEQQASIRRTVLETGIPVNSICADYFMKYRLDGPQGKESGLMAKKIIKAAAEITAQKLVLIPFLEQNAYPTENERAQVIANLAPAIKLAEDLGVRIGFETEMPVPELMALLERFQSPAVGVYYDIGNCTSYGFDCPTDLRTLGKKVYGVHIKDRKKGSAQSEVLGLGEAQLPACLKALEEIGFDGVPIMQAWRGVDYIKDARDQLNFLKRITGEK